MPCEMMLVVLVPDFDVNQLISSSKDIDMFSLLWDTSFSTFSAYFGTVLPNTFVLRRARRGCTSAMVGRAMGGFVYALSSQVEEIKQ